MCDFLCIITSRNKRVAYTFLEFNFFFPSPANTCKGIIYYSSLCSLSCYYTCVFKQLVNLFALINFEMLFLLILLGNMHPPSFSWMRLILLGLQDQKEGQEVRYGCLFVCFYLFTKCYLLVITYVSNKRYMYCPCSSQVLQKSIEYFLQSLE